MGPAPGAQRFRLQVVQAGKAPEWVDVAAASEADAILQAAGRGWQVLALQGAQVAERQARLAGGPVGVRGGVPMRPGPGGIVRPVATGHGRA